MRYRCAAAVALLLGLVSVGAFSPSTSVTGVAKDAAAKSPLFRAPSHHPAAVAAVARSNAARPLGIKKRVRHAVALTAAALIWSGAHVPEAHARTRAKQQEPPMTRMMKVKKAVAESEYKQYLPATGTVLIATGAGIVLGRQTVEKDDNEKEAEKEESTEFKRDTNVAAAVDDRLKKLNENKEKTQKILDRIAELETDDVIDQYQLRASAQEETRKILDRIRLERQKQNVILRAEPESTAHEETQAILDRIRLERQQQSGILPTTTRSPATSYADQLPSNVQQGSSGVESNTDKLSTNEIVNALIEKHAELAKAQMTVESTVDVESPQEPFADVAKEAVPHESTAEPTSPVNGKDAVEAETPTKPVEASSDSKIDALSDVKLSSSAAEVTQEVLPKKQDSSTEKVTPKVDISAAKPDAASVEDNDDKSFTLNGDSPAKVKNDIVAEKADSPQDTLPKSTDSVDKADTSESDNVVPPTLSGESPSEVTKEVVADKQDTPANEPVDVKGSITESEKAVADKSEDIKVAPPTPVAKKQDTVADASVPEKSNTREASNAADAKAPTASVNTSPKVTGEAKIANGKSVELNGKSTSDESGKKNGERAVVPLEEVYPVTSSHIQLDETSVTSAKEKSAWRGDSVDSLEEKAFTTLAELGLVELHQDPKSVEYDNSNDDEFVIE